ncbi:MAG: FlgD immunoglobulin-like domain containing protein [Candidatus Eisenbacteria bacterium]
MNVIFDEYPGQVVPIRIHTWWPSSVDQFFVFAYPEDSLRVRFYGGLTPWTAYYYTPSFRFDGKYVSDPSDSTSTGGDMWPTYASWYARTREVIDSLLTVPSPLRISVTRNCFSPDSDSVYVDFDVVAEDDADYNQNLYLAVTEWRHRYTFPTGTHDHALRDYVPDQDGMAIGPMLSGDSLHFEWDYIVYPEYWHAASGTSRVNTNLFVQRAGTRKVQQAWTGHPGEFEDPVSGVAIPRLADAIWLGKNSPNPFSEQTSIAYNVRRAGHVRLSVYTLEGRLVADLVDGQVDPGSYAADWDGRDRFGHEVGSGVYYFSLKQDKSAQTGKMIVLR